MIESLTLALALYGAYTQNWILMILALLIWASRRPGARCFSEHSRVLLPDGSALPIAHVHKGMTVMGSCGRPRRVVRVKRHRAAPVVFLLITTEDGLSIETTPDHFLVTQQGFVLASDAREGAHYLRRVDGRWSRIQKIERVSTTAPTFNIWVDRSPYLLINGLVATPACMSSTLLPLMNDIGVLKPLTTLYATVAS